MMMRVLLVEDNAVMAAITEKVLREEKFIVDTTDLGEDGLEIGKLYDYDIIILDLMLPDMDGYEVLRRLRAAQVRTPVLIMSALAELEHKIKGLRTGADDFMVKPFDRRELVARIQAIVRRSKGHPHSIIRIGKLAIDLDNRSAAVGGHPVNLTVKEYGIVELLSLRKDTIVTKEAFLNHLYGGDDEPDLKIIDVFVCKLRKKLVTATGGDHYIDTVWGRGYVMHAPADAVVPLTAGRSPPASRRSTDSTMPADRSPEGSHRAGKHPDCRLVTTPYVRIGGCERRQANAVRRTRAF
jgi:two-component system cell cycle response regulator CtrA